VGLPDGQTKYSNIAFDDAGNTYATYFFKESASNVDYFLLRVIKVDPTGNILFRVDLQTDVQQAFLAVSHGPNPNIAVATNYYSAYDYATHDYDRQSLVTEFDSSGHQLWYSLIPNSISLGVDVDSTGQIYFARSPLQPSNYWQTWTEIYTFSKNGTVLTDKVLPHDLQPFTATHVSHRWYVGGSLANGTVGAVPEVAGAWGVFDDASGARFFGGTTPLQPIDGPDYSWITAKPVPSPSGAVTVLSQQQIFNVNWEDNFPSYWFASLYRYSPTGQLAWGPSQFNGNNSEHIPISLDFSDGGDNGPGYMFSRLLFQFTSMVSPVNGAGPNNKFLGDVILADTSGSFSKFIQQTPFTWDLNLARHDTTGNLLWVVNLGIADKYDPFQYEGALATNADSIYSIDTGPYRDPVLQRWVTGIALQTVSGPTSIAPGQTQTLKVTLNAAAPSGGLMVTLHSNSPKLLFPNGSQTYSVPVYYGSIYAFVQVHETAGAATGTAVVQAVSRGVVRNLTVSLH
jgi:hypothetical protein